MDHTVKETCDAVSVIQPELFTPKPGDTYPLWVIWSNQHGLWWAGNGASYTDTFEMAGRYSTEDALAIVRNSSVEGRVLIHRDGIRCAPEVAIPLFGGAYPYAEAEHLLKPAHTPSAD